MYDVIFPREVSKGYEFVLYSQLEHEINPIAKPYLQLMKASVVEEMAWCFHRRWANYYDLSSIYFNNTVSINEPDLENMVFYPIIKASNRKPCLLIHNGQSSMDLFILQYVFYIMNLKVPYKITPFRKQDLIYLEKSLSPGTIDISQLTLLPEISEDRQKEAINQMLHFIEENKLMIQMSIKDKFLPYVVNWMKDRGYIIPVCITYETIVDDCMIGKRGISKKIASRIDNIQTLRMFHTGHVRSRFLINFSQPVDYNDRHLLKDSQFIFSRIEDQRRIARVEVLSTLLLFDRTMTKSQYVLTENFKRALGYLDFTFHVSKGDRQESFKRLKKTISKINFLLTGNLFFKQNGNINYYLESDDQDALKAYR